MTDGRLGYRYRDLGPQPGTYWARPDVAERLRHVSAIVRDLHDRAGNVAAIHIANQTQISQTTVSHLLGGRRLPTWELTRRIALVLAVEANAEWPPVEARLRAAYIKIYDRGSGS